MLAAGTARARILGMVHLPPLPGTPFASAEAPADALESAVASARALEEGGADGCLVQTVDRVYSVEDDADPARVAAMALVVRAVVEATGPGFLVGAHLLRNAVRASLAVARVTGGDFVRVGTLVGETLTTHGRVAPDPMQIMEYRRRIDAWPVAVLADVDSMHAHWDGPPRSLAGLASAAATIGADGVCVSRPDPAATVRAAEEIRAGAPRVPVVVAGNTRHDTVAEVAPHVDALFVGSCLERDGWGGRVDAELTRRYVEAARSRDPRA